MVPVASLTLALLLAGSAPATAAYDVPSMTVLSVDRSSITLEVAAGPSGAPAGFTVDWITKADYVALGGWPSDEYHPAIKRCRFDGTPTLTVGGDASSYRLGSGQRTWVEVGDLFDETGIDTEYLYEVPAGTEFVVRLFANGDGNNSRSAFSADMTTTTQAQVADCTYTQGFWKNHEEAWPVNNLTLGNNNYTKAQLLSILNTPAAGNGLVFLAHQLIATKLNLANGASPECIQNFVNAADALIGNLVVPPIGGGFIAPANASGLTQNLDDYNNGNLCSPHCDVVPTESTTWGKLKGTYR